MVIADNRQVVAEAGPTRQRGAVRVEIDAQHGFPGFDFLSPDDNLMCRPEAMITNQDINQSDVTLRILRGLLAANTGSV